MQVKIRHSPSNAVARCELEGGEVIKVQPDAMIAHSPGVVLTAGADGGVMKGLKRKVLGGESFFITTYTAPAEGGWVDVATHLLGDVFSLEVSDGHGLLHLARRLGRVEHRHLDRRQVGRPQEPDGRRGRLHRARHRRGHAACSRCFGALDIWDLADGETFVLDTNHMVAYDESVNYTLRRAVEGRSIQSLKSGEGWVFEFTGPGRVYGQTRSPQSLMNWLQSTLSGSSSSPTGGGALGSLLTR